MLTWGFGRSETILILEVCRNQKLYFMTNYKTLEAWKKAMLLVKDIYLLVKAYPKEELYGLTSQTKRASVSVPCIAVMVEIIEEKKFAEMTPMIDECLRILNGLIKYYENKGGKRSKGGKGGKGGSTKG
jgi:23S rRNA-intervening sequence protein